MADIPVSPHLFTIPLTAPAGKTSFQKLHSSGSAQPGSEEPNQAFYTPPILSKVHCTTITPQKHLSNHLLRLKPPVRPCTILQSPSIHDHTFRSRVTSEQTNNKRHGRYKRRTKYTFHGLLQCSSDTSPTWRCSGSGIPE